MMSKGMFIRKLLACLLAAMMLVTMSPTAFVQAEEAQEPGAVVTTPPVGSDPTAEPTEESTEEPAIEPTVEPTEEAPVGPTEETSVEPTAEPTEETSAEPTEESSVEPTAEPTEEISVEPTAKPTEETSVEPTEESSAEPIVEPAEVPIVGLAAAPTGETTSGPTAEPTEELVDQTALEALSVSITGIPAGTNTATSLALSAKVTSLLGYNENTSGMTFQWYVDGSPISGATSKNYTINFAAGTYGSKVVKVTAEYKGFLTTYTGKTTETIDYDLRPLAITDVAFTGGYGGGWTNADVGISFNVVCSTTILTSVTVNGTALTVTGPGAYAATISAEGSNIVTIVAVDSTNASATNTDLTTKIDKTAPTIVASVDPSDWTNDLYATVTATGTDALSGFKKLQYRIDGTVWLDVLLSNTFTAYPIISHKYEFRATDNVGNTSAVTTVYAKLDHIAPLYDLDVTPLLWTNDANGVKITVKSILDSIDTNPVFLEGSGVAAVKIGTETLTDDGNGNYIYYSTTEGKTEYEVSVTDNAGNKRTRTATAYYDVTAPTYKVSVVPGDWTNDGSLGVKITVYDVSDSKAGVNHVSGVASVSIGGHYVLPNLAGQFVVICKTEGKTAFDISVKDWAGNEAGETVYAYIDLTKPSFTLRLSEDDWTKNNVTITIDDITDANGLLDVSDIDSVTVDGNAATMISATKYGYEITAEGSIEHTVVVTDNAGNSTTKKITTKIDKTAPTFDVDGDTDWTNQDVTLTISNVSDAKSQVALVSPTPIATSGIKKVTVDGVDVTSSYDSTAETYSYVVTAEGEIEHTVVVTDNAGNSTTKKITTKIDKTAPTFDVNGDTDWTNQDVTLTISNVSDAKSQVALAPPSTTPIATSGIKTITVDGDDVMSSYDSTTQTYSYTVTAEGEIEHTAVVTDNAGNSTTKKITTKIDKTAPSATLSSNLTLNTGAQWTSQESVTIKVTAQDPAPEGVNAVSGLATKYMWFAESAVISGLISPWTSNPELTINFDKSGIYTVYPYVRDAAGNVYEMDSFTVNYVSDDLTVTIGSPITSRTTEIGVSVSETAAGPQVAPYVEPPKDYYVGAGASTGHEVTVALTLLIDGTEVSDPSVYFTGSATISLGGNGTITFQARTVNDEKSGLSWTDYLPAGSVVAVGTVTDSLSLDVISRTATNLTFDPVTVDRTEGAITLGFEGTVGSTKWMKNAITINGLAGEVVRIVVTDANGATATYYKKLANGTATLEPEAWWHEYDDSTKSHNDKTISVGYIDTDDLYNTTGGNVATIAKTSEVTEETFWFMYQAYDEVDTVAAENRGKTIDIDVPEPDMQITSITFDGAEYLDAAVNADAGTPYTLAADLLDWWTEASGPALSGRKCKVVVTTKDAAGNTATTTVKADISETDRPIKFAVKPELIEGDDYSLMSGRTTLTIKGTANEYETLNVKIGSYHTTVRVGGNGNYGLGAKGWFSLNIDMADLDLPTGEPFEITISYRDISGKPFTLYVLYDAEIAPILLTVAPNDRSPVGGIVEPGSRVQMVYGGVTYEATVDEYGSFTFEGQDIALVAGEEVTVIATDMFGNTTSRTFTVISGMTTTDLYPVGKTFLYEAEKDDATLQQLSAFASEGAYPSEDDQVSVWFSAVPVTEEDLADGTFEIPLLLANQFVVGTVTITRQDDGSYVASYQIDEALSATVNADDCYLGIAFTGEIERLSTTGDSETPVKVQPEARDFKDATAVGFDTTFALDFGSYVQTWIIVRVPIKLDTANLASLIPMNDDLLELYETYQLNN